MRTLAIVFALALFGAAVLLAPAASASGYCTNALGGDCPGRVCYHQAWGWTCEDDIIVCVREPCP